MQDVNCPHCHKPVSPELVICGDPCPHCAVALPMLCCSPCQSGRIPAEFVGGLQFCPECGLKLANPYFQESALPAPRPLFFNCRGACLLCHGCGRVGDMYMTNCPFCGEQYDENAQREFAAEIGRDFVATIFSIHFRAVRFSLGGKAWRVQFKPVEMHPQRCRVADIGRELFPAVLVAVREDAAQEAIRCSRIGGEYLSIDSVNPDTTEPGVVENRRAAYNHVCEALSFFLGALQIAKIEIVPSQSREDLPHLCAWCHSVVSEKSDCICPRCGSFEWLPRSDEVDVLPIDHCLICPERYAPFTACPTCPDRPKAA